MFCPSLFVRLSSLVYEALMVTPVSHLLLSDDRLIVNYRALLPKAKLALPYKTAL